MIETALRATEVAIAVAVAIGTLELFALRRTFADNGTWQWATLAPEMPLLAPLLAWRPFLVVLGVRLACAVLLLAGVRGPTVPLLWITSLLVNVRFRGTFNGGSDAMTMVVLTGLAAAHLGDAHPVVVKGAFLFIGAQAVLSYFIAGVVKVVNPDWRSGAALRSFVTRADVSPPALAVRLADNRGAITVASWAVMGVECAFPLALTGVAQAWGFVAVAALFHLGNVAVFGLNRFLLAWAASWPSIIYASGLWPS